MVYKLLVGIEPFKKTNYTSVQNRLTMQLSLGAYSYREAFGQIFGTVNYEAIGVLLTSDTRSFISGLLEMNAESRLGYSINKITGHETLMLHPFFASIDWSLLESKQLPPPYLPHDEAMESVGDTTCFPKPFVELMKNINKTHWCEEFQAAVPAVGQCLKESRMKVHHTMQYYFRMWNYSNPKYFKSGTPTPK